MKNILSHLLPIRLKKYHSKISGDIEINLINGRRVVDTQSSNYSYGSLQRIFSKVLHKIKFNSLAIDEILVLGMGAGSIIDTIRNEFGSTANIDLVEIDETMIQIAKKEFQIEKYNSINIFHIDAANYIAVNKKKYDLILIDLFVIDTIPAIFTQDIFLQHIISSLSNKGILVYNTMNRTMPRNLLIKIQNFIKMANLEVYLYENINYTNDIIIASVRLK